MFLFAAFHALEEHFQYFVQCIWPFVRQLLWDTHFSSFLVQFYSVKKEYDSILIRFSMIHYLIVCVYISISLCELCGVVLRCITSVYITVDYFNMVCMITSTRLKRSFLCESGDQVPFSFHVATISQRRKRTAYTTRTPLHYTSDHSFFVNVDKMRTLHSTARTHHHHNGTNTYVPLFLHLEARLHRWCLKVLKQVLC